MVCLCAKSIPEKPEKIAFPRSERAGVVISGKDFFPFNGFKKSETSYRQQILAKIKVYE